jgi:anti-sigma-K factor RskA
MMSARLSGTPHGPTVFVAVYDPGRHAIVLTPASVSAAAGRSPELWLIPTGGKPVALGVAAFDGSVQLAPAAGEGVSRGVLAVSVEPKGGSPTGQPTGPVIATGQLAQL